MLWPWLQKTLWPVIKQAIAEIVLDIFKHLRKKLVSIFDDWTEEKKRRYRQKAEEAQESASESHDQSEFVKYKALAEAHYEFARELEEQNSELKNKVEDLFESAEYSADRGINDLDLSHNKTGVAVGDRQIPFAKNADDSE